MRVYNFISEKLDYLNQGELFALLLLGSNVNEAI